MVFIQRFDKNSMCILKRTTLLWALPDLSECVCVCECVHEIKCKLLIVTAIRIDHMVQLFEIQFVILYYWLYEFISRVYEYVAYRCDSNE